jgi:hypothetical protein
MSKQTKSIMKIIFFMCLCKMTSLAFLGLGSAEPFAILSKAGITNVTPSAIKGKVGTSPITGVAIKLTCVEVTGEVYSVDATGPAPCVKPGEGPLLTPAIGDMDLAYTSAAAQPNNFNEIEGGVLIDQQELEAGVYKWSGNLLLPSRITLKGNQDSQFIFQVAQTMKTVSGGTIMTYSGVNPNNVIWQVGEEVVIGINSQMAGTILGKTMIQMTTGASINGRLFAGTAVVLQMATVTKP